MEDYMYQFFKLLVITTLSIFYALEIIEKIASKRLDLTIFFAGKNLWRWDLELMG